MNVTLRKISSKTATVFNRAVQYTEEKLGAAEKTELSEDFESLMVLCEKTKVWTERIIKQTETVVQPNPNHKIEDILKRKDGLTQTQQLGHYLIDAGNDLGDQTPYGNALIKCGNTQMDIGYAEKECMQTALNNFLQPLKHFLNGDMKAILKEKKILETKRLDLDACKHRLKKLESQARNNDGLLDVKEADLQAELRARQLEFDRQMETTKILLDGINSTHDHHLRCLKGFIETQQTYYSQCALSLTNLQKHLDNELEVDSISESS